MGKRLIWGKSAYLGKWRISAKKPQIQSCITQFFKNNKKWVLIQLRRLKVKKYKLFIFPKTSSTPNKHIMGNVLIMNGLRFDLKFLSYEFIFTKNSFSCICDRTCPLRVFRKKKTTQNLSALQVFHKAGSRNR